MLLYELVILRHSPELAAFRAILLLFAIIFYQEIRNAITKKNSLLSGIISGFRIVIKGMIQGSKNMISVALACAAAGIIVGIVNMGLGGMIANIVENLAQGNLFLLLLIYIN